jgi:cation diffusion facilitator family transporter
MIDPKHRHSTDEHTEHDHVHGVVDPTILSSERGIWAVKWSFIGLMITAGLQVIIVFYTGSVALFADTIHNFGDAATAIPLWIAFRFAQLKPSNRFTYGYGKAEDLAGVAVVMLILFSAIVAGYESIQRLLDPQPIKYIGAIAAAAIVGFLGNELVAMFRIRVGKEIHSAALVADGYHARVDGLTSLAVLGSAVGVWLGFPLADPIVGLVITALILRIMWSVAKTVFLRMLDGVDPSVIDEIRHSVDHAEGVVGVSEVRARWIGHWLHGEVNLAVSSNLSIREAHAVANEARHMILHSVPYLSNVVIHVDPAESSGEAFHRIDEHEHDEFEVHFHP